MCGVDEDAIAAKIDKRISKLYKRLIALSDKAFVKAFVKLPACDLVLLYEMDQPSLKLVRRCKRLTEIV